MPDLRLFVLILLCYQRAAFVAVPLNSPTQQYQTLFSLKIKFLYFNENKKQNLMSIIIFIQHKFP